MKKIHAILAASVFALAMTGCNDDATVARHNMTKAADNFELMQRLNLQERGFDGRILKSYNSRQYRYPFVYELGGKMFKCSEDAAKRYFSK
jgi:hypothetical protein